MIYRQRDKKIRTGIIFFIMGVLILFSGCATQGPQKPSGNFVWPPPPETARIKWLTQWSDRFDFGRPNAMFTLLVGEEQIERLQRPNGVVADSAGSVYVADSELAAIFVFDQEKGALRFIGQNTLSTPIDLALDEKRGILFVSDSKAAKVYGLDKNTGNVVMAMGAPGEFRNPSGLAYDDQRERLYLSDTQNHTVRVFDKNGRPLLKFGQRGSGDGEFNYPSYLALDKQGRLYVVDTLNFRIQVFDSDGQFIRKFGSLGDTLGSFTRPTGIGLDSDGHVYVVDSAFNNFQIFDETGTLLLPVGNVGRGPGQFFLPTGMYIDRQDRIYIADVFNWRIQVFQYLKVNE